MTAASPAAAALTRAVKAKLDQGTPLGDVIAQLASSLAASVAAQLGISPQAAQQRLTQAFNQALQPTDTGPPVSTAERASALVSRFRQIAELATRVTNGDQGQPIRQIAGNSSDAVTAKANPAPDPDSILRDAQKALTASAPPTATTTAALGSDDRTVAFAPLQAIASGGDTPLGRILTRAVLADSSRTVPADTPIDGPSHHLAGGVQPVEQPVLGPSTTTGTSAAAAVDAFVTAFASALARSDGAGGERHAGDIAAPVAASTAPAPPATATAQPVASFALSTAHDAVSIAPPTPPQTMPQPQHVDANAVVDQILRGMQIRTTDGQSEVRFRLVPEQLGDVSVKLIVSGGSVDASITAHTADAQSALAGAQTQLAKSLADAGLKLQSFSVGLAGGFADPRDQSRPNDRSTGSASRRIGAVEAADADASPDPSLLAVPSFGPPIYAANPALGALNYLV
jgi:flagellar hook-length control protein FliK